MEPFLKREMAELYPDSRFSFSQRGWVIFKLGDGCDAANASNLVTARTWGRSLFSLALTGQESGVPRWNPKSFLAAIEDDSFPREERIAECVDGLLKNLREQSVGPIQHLHCWVRDGLDPAGQFQRSAAARPLSPALRQWWDAIFRALLNDQILVPDAGLNQNAKFGDTVLDVCLLSPTQFWVGTHQAMGSAQRWPGGVLPLVPTENEVISRAYYKVREAAAWAQLPIRPGMVAAEIGAAPGGSCQWLLEQGFQVLGIDPAEVDPQVSQHPRFTHVRKRGREVRRRELRKIDWLLSDANVAPDFILDTFEDLVGHPEVNPSVLIVTLKLPDLKLLTQIHQWQSRVRSWGYDVSHCRQLVFNRQEICLVATKST